MRKEILYFRGYPYSCPTPSPTCVAAALLACFLVRTHRRPGIWEVCHGDHFPWSFQNTAGNCLGGDAGSYARGRVPRLRLWSMVTLRLMRDRRCHSANDVASPSRSFHPRHSLLHALEYLYMSIHIKTPSWAYRALPYSGDEAVEPHILSCMLTSQGGRSS